MKVTEAIKSNLKNVILKGVILATSLFLTLISRIELFSSDSSRDADFRKILTNTLLAFHYIQNRVPPFCQFLDAIFGCLTKDVAGQYKVNAKKIRFFDH